MKHIGKLQAVDSSGPEAQCIGDSLCLLFWLSSISYLFLLVVVPPISFGVDILLFCSFSSVETELTPVVEHKT